MNLLKCIFGGGEDKDAEATPPPLFRIRPHFEGSEYWAVDYCWKDGKAWTPLPEASVTYLTIRPKMSYKIFRTQDSALKTARDLKGEGMLQAWILWETEELEKATLKWDAKVAALKERKEIII